jgi:Bifunctional DNA primase/polymerase, N-terminal
MTIPFFSHRVQGLGASREVLRGMSSPERRATALHGLTYASPPVIAATALAYLAAGRSVVPIAPGCKAPSVIDPRTGRRVLIRWERYQEEPSTPAEVQRWFAGPQPMGIGIVAGPVSGVTLADGRRAGLEFLDVDDADVHARFVARLAARGVRFLLDDLPCEATPRGGRHYGYGCVEWATSTTLARRPVGTTPDGRDQMVTLIESRGQGASAWSRPPHRAFTRTMPRRGIRWCRGTGYGFRSSAQRPAASSGRAPVRWMRLPHGTAIIGLPSPPACRLMAAGCASPPSPQEYLEKVSQ